jgi:hypothetical protein
LQEPHFLAQIVGVVVRLAMDDEHLAVGRPLLKRGDERAVEIGGSTQAGYQDRKPRHG